LLESIKPWLSNWKWNKTAQDFLQFWFEAEHNIDRNVVSIIEQIRKEGIKCFLATNQEKYRTEYIKKKMGFENLFDYIFSSSEIGFKKPEKEFYEFILNKIKKEYNIQPQEVLFFDDSKENVEIAKELKIRAYVYKDFRGFKRVIKKNLDKKLSRK
jgi:putative hydrolase of the HAD superfamily